MVLTAVDIRTDDSRVDSTRPVGKKKEGKERLVLVEVSWTDSYTDGGWAEYSPEAVETKTYGLLVKKTREWTTLAMTKEKGYWGNLWYIPTKNVLRMRVIEDSSA